MQKSLGWRLHYSGRRQTTIGVVSELHNMVEGAGAKEETERVKEIGSDFQGGWGYRADTGQLRMTAEQDLRQGGS